MADTERNAEVLEDEGYVLCPNTEYDEPELLEFEIIVDVYVSAYKVYKVEAVDKDHAEQLYKDGLVPYADTQYSDYEEDGDLIEINEVE